MMLFSQNTVPGVATDPQITAAADSISSKISQLGAVGLKEQLHNFDWSAVLNQLSTAVSNFAMRIVAAIVIFYVGKFIIYKIHSILHRIMVRRDIDESLASFSLSFIKITLMFILIITVISILGIETSSFIAVFASAGVAVGMALSGTLQNFAGGVLILLLKPYKVGDYITYDKYQGFVKEIQIFHTVINTYDNERIIIPNGGLSTGTIDNFSSEEHHRIQWRVSLAYGDDIDKARSTAMQILAADNRIIKQDFDDTTSAKTAKSNVAAAVKSTKKSLLYRLFHHSRKTIAPLAASLTETEIPSTLKRDCTPYVAVENLNDSSVDIVIRAWTLSKDYWPTFYAISEEIYKQFPANGLHFPFPQIDVHFNKSQQNDEA